METSSKFIVAFRLLRTLILRLAFWLSHSSSYMSFKPTLMKRDEGVPFLKQQCLHRCTVHTAYRLLTLSGHVITLAGIKYLRFSGDLTKTPIPILCKHEQKISPVYRTHTLFSRARSFFGTFLQSLCSPCQNIYWDSSMSLPTHRYSNVLLKRGMSMLVIVGMEHLWQ